MTPAISLPILIRRFWKRTAPTWILVIFEGIILIALPLVIGRAVDDLMAGSYRGLIELGGLCLSLLVVGAGRRFYDTRIYAGIYRKVGREMVGREIDRDTTVSKVSARLTLFGEFVDFLEDALPDLFNHMIGLCGTLGIILVLDIRIFCLCLTGIGLTVLIYWCSRSRMLGLNKGQNNCYEHQVDVLSSRDRGKLATHLKKLMTWNIRLSDLETVNFSATWIVLSVVLLTAILLLAAPGTTTGQMLTMIMYVFGFIESVLTFPLYYQQMVRLREIAGRLG
ncbi:MAG: ABC transporter six-transmembrane domain-containing protein [Desulfobacterales bacterium]|nr:ABC transporter six-transmembrane domain-containing protein [Desulfobacterales bacterium]